MSRQSITVITQGLWATINRFPLAALCSLLFTGLAVLQKKPGVELLALFCCFFWFVALQLFVESRGWNWRRYLLIGLPVAGAIGAYIGTAPKPELFVGFMGWGLFLAMFVAPFLRREATSAQLWCFNYRLWVHIGFTVLAAAVLFLGIAAIMSSLEFLFGLDIKGDIYGHVWVTVACLFAPLFAMSGIPRQFDAEREEYPRIVRIIKAYITLPLLLVYTLLLYAYLVKIAAGGELPKGNVAILVSLYGALGIFAWLSTYPLHGQPGIMALFSRWFFRVLLAPLVVLGLAIFVRVREYGVTEERYGVILCLVWLAISAFFVLLRDKAQAPKYVLASVAGLLIVASFGPWGAVSLSQSSQYARLERILERNGMLADGTARLPAAEVPVADRKEASAIIDYLVRTQKTRRLEGWIAQLPQSKTTAGDPKSAWALTDRLGVGYLQFHERRENEDQTFYYRTDWKRRPYISVAGYDYLITLDDVWGDLETKFRREVVLDHQGRTLTLVTRFEPETSRYLLSFAGQQGELAFDLAPAIVVAASEQNRKQLHPETPRFEGELDGAKVTLLLTHMQGQVRVQENNTPEIRSLSVVVMLRMP